MPVEVSLYELVLVADSRRAWPEEFRNLVEACEVDMSDRLPFGVVADWCDERGEAALGEAWRWLHKRPDVLIGRRQSSIVWYELTSLPKTMGTVIQGDSGHGLIGVVVALAERLAEMREALS